MGWAAPGGAAHVVCRGYPGSYPPQVFNLNDAKVDLDIAYVVMVIYACCKRMFQVFQVFQTFVLNVSSRCFKS